MQKEQFQQFLKDQGACLNARRFCEGKGMRQAYESIERPDWILWLANRMIGMKGAPTIQTIIEAACDCAETALKYVLKGEDRPRKAIEAARIVIKVSTEENKKNAANAAYAANAAANAAYAANDAANAAYAANAAAYAANAAAYAANAAVYAAVYAAVNAANAAVNAANAAVNAANAAVNAANAAAYAAVNAAYAADYAAAYAAANDAAKKEMCDIIRKKFNLKWKRHIP